MFDTEQMMTAQPAHNQQRCPFALPDGHLMCRTRSRPPRDRVFFVPDKVPGVCANAQKPGRGRSTVTTTGGIGYLTLQYGRNATMLYTIAVVLIILWLLGLVTSTTMGGFIHVLLVIAAIVILLRIINGRSPL